MGLPDPTGILARLGINGPLSPPPAEGQHQARQQSGLKAKLADLLKKLPKGVSLPDCPPACRDGTGRG